jgi:hypothetical protein
MKEFSSWIRFGKLCRCGKLTSPAVLQKLPMEDNNEENIKNEQTV